MPDMTLNKVLLPDPLGPITPSNSPSLTLRSIPASARTPLKLRDTERALNTLCTFSQFLRCALQPLRQQGKQSFREKHHAKQKQKAVRDHAVFAKRPQILGR